MTNWQRNCGTADINEESDGIFHEVTTLVAPYLGTLHLNFLGARENGYYRTYL